MNKTITLLITALHFYITLTAMTVKQHQNFNLSLLTMLPPEIKQHIKDYAQLPQWWYLRQQIINVDMYGDFVAPPICFDHSKKLFAMGCYNLMSIFNLKQNKKIASFNCGVYTNFVCFNQSGTSLATSSWDRHIRIFDIKQNKQSFFSEYIYADSICFDNTGKLLAAIIHQHKIDIVDVKQKKMIASFDHDNWVEAVSFDHSGKFLVASSSSNKKACIVAVEQNQIIADSHHAIISARFVSMMREKYL